MASIARAMLLHDRLRFVITIGSLAFAMVMIVYDIGVFIGIITDSVNLIDRAQADLWVLEEGSTHILAPSLVAEQVLTRFRALDGVDQVCALNLMPGSLEIASDHDVQVVGIDPACPMILPWDVVAGDLAALPRADAVILDRLAVRGESARVGDTVLLNGRQLRVVALTRHNKSFTTAYAYTNLRTFEDLGGVPGFAHFVAVRQDPGTDRARLARRLAGAAPGIAVYEMEKVRSATMTALIARGVGAIFVVIFVGVLVGILIITMTVYTSTMDRLPQFAILKAIGAPNSRILGIILAQAVTVTTVSFVWGLALSVGLNVLVQEQMGMRAAFPPRAMGAAFAMMVVLAVLGSLISVRKALTVDPMIVFRA